MQNLTTQVNRELAQDLSLAATVLKRKEVIAAAGNPGIAKMHYGNAVERLVANRVEKDSLLRSLFEHNLRGPDFTGKGHLQGQLFDITTPGQALRHLNRPYGENLQIITYERPPGF